MNKQLLSNVSDLYLVGSLIRETKDYMAFVAYTEKENPR